jgi:hypothetical protein
VSAVLVALWVEACNIVGLSTIFDSLREWAAEVVSITGPSPRVDTAVK